jgi:flagellar biosynthesis protein FlhF
MRKAKEALGPDARLVSARRVTAPDVPPVYEVCVSPAEREEPVSREGLEAIRREIRELKDALTELTTERLAPSASAPFGLERPEPESVPFLPTEPSPLLEATPRSASAVSEALPARSILAPRAEERFQAPRRRSMGLALSETEPAARPPAPPKEAVETGDPPVDPEFERWSDLLERRGVGSIYAHSLVEAALRRAAHGLSESPLEALAEVLAERLATGHAGDFGLRSTILVGPTGAGKTTVLAKIAAELARATPPPVLVTTDGESLTGEDSVEAIAGSLGLAFETAFLPGQMEALVEKHGSETIFLVDTPGRTPFEREGISSLKGLTRALPEGEVVLVLPATIDGEEARSVLAEFEKLGIDRLVITKLDELYKPGRLVDLAETVTRPIARVTYGRTIRSSAAPEDPRVVSRILGSSRSLES